MLAERLSRLEGREKLGLILVVLALSVLILDATVIRPLNARCALLDGDIAVENKTRRYQTAVLSVASVVEQRFAAIRSRLGAPLPASEVINLMRGEIDGLATTAGMVVEMKPRDPHKSEFYDEYAIDLTSFDADEEGLVTFLQSLVTTSGTFRVTKLKVAPDAAGKRLKGSMTVTKVMMSSAPPAASVSPAAAPNG